MLSFSHWKDCHKGSILDYTMYVLDNVKNHLNLEDEQVLMKITKKYEASVPV